MVRIFWLGLVVLLLNGCGDTTGDTTTQNITTIEIIDSEITCFNSDSNNSECTTEEFNEAIDEIISQV